MQYQKLSLAISLIWTRTLPYIFITNFMKIHQAVLQTDLKILNTISLIRLFIMTNGRPKLFLVMFMLHFGNIFHTTEVKHQQLRIFNISPKTKNGGHFEFCGCIFRKIWSGDRNLTLHLQLKFQENLSSGSWDRLFTRNIR